MLGGPSITYYSYRPSALFVANNFCYDGSNPIVRTKIVVRSWGVRRDEGSTPIVADRRRVRSSFGSFRHSTASLFNFANGVNRRSTLPTVIARDSRFLCGRALRNGWGLRSQIKGTIHHTLLRFAKESSRDVHPQLNVIVRGSDS